ncbi:MAG: sialidase family protein, partial [Kiritimatiellae bacterium]|nr:sialidase family protein [Kiritimatiellia bacterium]
MKRVLKCLVFAAALPAAFSAAAPFEWQIKEEGPCQLVVPDEAALRFPEGFKATVKFACDLDKIGERSNHANLFTKGKDFHDGYSVMVRKDGKLLVDIKGIMPQYYVCHDVNIESLREYLLEVYVTKTAVRIFLDGVESGSYPFAGQLGYADVKDPLKIGSTGGYSFTGKLPLVRLEPIADVRLPPGGPRPLLTEAPKRQPLAELLWTRPICVQKGRYIGWATAILTQKGTILAAFSGDRDAHVCPWGKTQLVRSDDGGENWSDAMTINNSAVDDRDCGMLQLANGEILVIWASFASWTGITGFMTNNYAVSSQKYQWRQHALKLPPDVISAHSGIWCARSSDDGKTWSKPEKLTTMSAFTPHGPIQLKDGTLFQIGRTSYKEPDLRGRTRITTMRSSDGGHLWEQLCYALPDKNGENSQPQMSHEPHAIELKDGRLMMLVR